MIDRKQPGRKPRYSTAMVQLHARIPPDVKAAMIAEFGGVQAAVDKLVIEVLSPCPDYGASPIETGCDSCRGEERHKVKTILERHVFIYDGNNDKLYPEGVDKAADAIVKLVQSQPVDRVRAMALFVRGKGKRFYVPCPVTSKAYVIDITTNGTFCHDESYKLCSRGSCEHVQAVELAVKLYQERKGAEDVTS